MMGVCRAPARSATRWRRRSPGLSDRGSPPCSGIGAQPTGAPGDARGGGRLQTCLRPPTLFQARHKTITSSLKPSNLASGTPTLALATLPLTHVKGRLRATPPKDSQPLHRTVASPWGAEVGGGLPDSPHFLCERSPQPAQRQQPLQGQTFVCSRVPAPQHFLTEECVVLTTNPPQRRVGWTGWPHRGDGGESEVGP